jgi:hypothetical protein
MVHELLGIHNGRVDLSMVPDIRPELSVCLFRFAFAHILMPCIGNNLDNDYRPFLSSSLPCDVRRPGHFPEELCPIISVAFPRPIIVVYKLNN